MNNNNNNNNNAPQLLLFSNPLTLGAAALTAVLGGALLLSSRGDQEEKDKDDDNIGPVTRQDHFKLDSNELRYWAAIIVGTKDPYRTLVDGAGDTYGRVVGATDHLKTFFYLDRVPRYLLWVCSQKGRQIDPYISRAAAETGGVAWQDFRFLERMMRACYFADPDHFLIGETFAKSVLVQKDNDEELPFSDTKYYRWSNAAVVTYETKGVLHCSGNVLLGPFAITTTVKNGKAYLNYDPDVAAVKFDVDPQNATKFFCDHQGRLVFADTKRFWRFHRHTNHTSVGPTTSSVRICSWVTPDNKTLYVLGAIDIVLPVLSFIRKDSDAVTWIGGASRIPKTAVFVDFTQAVPLADVAAVWPLYSYLKLTTLSELSPGIANSFTIPSSVITFFSQNREAIPKKFLATLLLNRGAETCGLFADKDMLQNVSADEMRDHQENENYYVPTYKVHGYSLYLSKKWCLAFAKGLDSSAVFRERIEKHNGAIVGFSPTENTSVVVALEKNTPDVGDTVGTLLKRSQKKVLLFLYGDNTRDTPTALATKCGLYYMSDNYRLSNDTDTVYLESQTEGFITLFRIVRGASSLDKNRNLKLYPRTNENLFPKHCWKFYWTNMEMDSSATGFGLAWSTALSNQLNLFNLLC